MTLDTLLGLLDSVRARGTSKWSARCPSHVDKSPSLSIGEGERGILLHCWAGCTVEEITAAMGLKPSDLFYDAGLPRHQRPISTRPRRIDLVALAFQFDLHALDLRLRADRITEAGQNLNVATMTDADLDRALGFVAQAQDDLERSELFERVADVLRARAFTERAHREHQRSA